jgi:transposase
MISLGGRTRVFIATGVTNLRCSWGLQATIEYGLGRPPLNGDVYVFINRRRDMVKLFFFDAGGIWICAKRLLVGTYRWPQHKESVAELTSAELQLLLSGLDLTKTRARKWWGPSSASSMATTPPSPSLGGPASGQSGR